MTHAEVIFGINLRLLKFGVDEEKLPKGAIPRIRQAIDGPLRWFKETLFGVALRRLTGEQKKGTAVVHVNNLESALSVSATQIDRQRDILNQSPHVLVCWIMPTTYSVLAELAPNFFSRHSGVFHLELPLTGLMDKTGTVSESALSTTVDPKDTIRLIDTFEERVSELQIDAESNWFDLQNLFVRLGELYAEVFDYYTSERPSDFTQKFENPTPTV